MTVESIRKSYTERRTAEINEYADAISALKVGDGLSVSLWTDVDAFSIIKRTATTITLQEDTATLADGWTPEFTAGGFSGHCTNQDEQTYDYERNPNGAIIKISLRHWRDENGNERRKWKRVHVRTFERGGDVYIGRQKFHDYNF